MNPNPVTSPIPMVQDQEARLAKMRRRLEGVFADLYVIRDVVVICAEACRSASGDYGDEFENVLRNHASDDLFDQMKVLTSIIENLGGRTRFTDNRETEEQLTAKAKSLSGEQQQS